MRRKLALRLASLEPFAERTSSDLGLVDDLEYILPVADDTTRDLVDYVPRRLAYYLKNHLRGGSPSTSQDKVLGLVCIHLALPAFVAPMSRPI